MRATTRVALLLTAAVLTACGAADAIETGADDATGAPPAMGMCAPGVTDCVDTVVIPEGDEFDSDSARMQARETLGQVEGDLDPEVRVSRRGDEQFVLTEDYRLGRITVELDADGEGAHRVVSATVELPDGPETFTE